VAGTYIKIYRKIGWGTSLFLEKSRRKYG